MHPQGFLIVSRDVLVQGSESHRGGKHDRGRQTCRECPRNADNKVIPSRLPGEPELADEPKDDESC